MKYDIFISYKRKGTSSATAAYLYELLQQKGYNVFFDRKELRSGRFNEQLLEHISNATDIIILLEEESLEAWFDFRIPNGGRSQGDEDPSGRQEEPYKADWFCKEIMHALSLKEKNIIPILLNGYSMPEEKDLPPEMKDLSLHQALSLEVSEVEEFYEKHFVEQGYIKSKPANPSLTRRFLSRGGVVGCFLFYTDVDSCDLYECGEKIATLTGDDDEWHPFRYTVTFAGEHRFRVVNNDSCEVITICCTVETNCQQYVQIQFTDTRDLWLLTKEEIMAQNDAERLFHWGRGLFFGTIKHAPDFALSLECLQRAIDLGSQNAQFFVASGSSMVYQKQASAEVVFKWYSSAAALGNREAQAYLGRMFLIGENVEQDYGKAFELFSKSAEQGDAVGQWFLGAMYEDGLGVERDYGKAFEWYSKSAEQGDVDGQRKLGLFYEEGLGVEQDYGKAFEWSLKSAEQGNTFAQWFLGVMYEDGLGVEQDYGKAFEWYSKSAEQGNAVGQRKLGYCYRMGLGVEQDYGKAFELFSKSAEQGDAVSQRFLGVMYEDGLGVEQNYGKAFEWYSKSAEQGDVVGQRKLGQFYKDGLGVEQDYEKAFEWYSKSAEQGDVDGQWFLGVMYEVGEGVNQDYGEAFKWYQKCAEQGDADGQFRLGVMYQLGRGIEQDYEKALEWYIKAAESGKVSSLNQVALVYHEMGNDDDALPWAEKAIAATPDDPVVVNALATVYEGLGRYDEALDHFEECLRLFNKSGEKDGVKATKKQITALKKKMAAGIQ